MQPHSDGAEPKLMRSQPLRRARCGCIGSAAVWAFCVPVSGRTVTQQICQCRGRTHVAMALCDPQRPPPCRRDGNEQACKPIDPTDPRNGCLEVECGRSAGGSPHQSGGGREEPSGASGITFAKGASMKPRIRKRHGVWVCSTRSMFGGRSRIMGHGYTPTEAWCDWARQMGGMA